MIECLDLMENVEKVIITKKEEYTQLKNQIDNEKENIKQEAEESKRELEKLNAEMDVVSGKIDPILLKTYLTIKDEFKRKPLRKNTFQPSNRPFCIQKCRFKDGLCFPKCDC